MDAIAERLYREIVKTPIIDPHSHIDPKSPVARSLNDLLGYHYYTELAHSAGLSKDEIEGAAGFDQVLRIVKRLDDCSNTVQYSWLVELSHALFGFHANSVTPSNVRDLFETVGKICARPQWESEVFAKTNLESIFLTNDFDDSLVGFDVRRYVPCLRTDELVFKLQEATVRERLARSTGTTPVNWSSLLLCLNAIFERFVANGARACAVSLPPDFAPTQCGQRETDAALRRVFRGNGDATDRRVVAYAVFFAIADRCAAFRLPFDLMIGVHRSVYSAGVYQGQDLFDKTTSLFQFRELFNAMSNVVFPVSVLTHNQNQELAAYAWIFPNVVTCGHWWYANVPEFIESDLRARLEAVPRCKQIGYYSDAYKLEFVLPKYNMYRRCLASVLGREFVLRRGWSEEQAIELARVILRDNVERVFPARS